MFLRWVFKYLVAPKIVDFAVDYIYSHVCRNENFPQSNWVAEDLFSQGCGNVFVDWLMTKFKSINNKSWFLTERIIQHANDYFCSQIDDKTVVISWRVQLLRKIDEWI